MVFLNLNIGYSKGDGFGKEINSLIFNDSPLTGVNTPGSDENSMKLNMN